MADENRLEGEAKPSETPVGSTESSSNVIDELIRKYQEDSEYRAQVDQQNEENQKELRKETLSNLSMAVAKLTTGFPIFEQKSGWSDVLGKISEATRVGSAISTLDLPGAKLSALLTQKMPSLDRYWSGTSTGGMQKAINDHDAYQSEILAGIAEAQAAKFQRETRDRETQEGIRETQEGILGQLVLVAQHAQEEKELAQQAYEEERAEAERQRQENSDERAKSDKHNNRMFMMNIVTLVVAIIGIAIAFRSLQVAQDAMKVSSAPQPVIHRTIAPPPTHPSTSVKPK